MNNATNYIHRRVRTVCRTCAAYYPFETTDTCHCLRIFLQFGVEMRWAVPQFLACAFDVIHEHRDSCLLHTPLCV
jgi:hypothetical protein